VAGVCTRDSPPPTPNAQPPIPEVQRRLPATGETDMSTQNGHENGAAEANGVEKSTWTTKRGLAQMLKGGVIMDVVTPEHARIAEDAGAVAVMALERVPADIRAQGGVA